MGSCLRVSIVARINGHANTPVANRIVALSKIAGNMTMEPYLTKIFRPYIDPAWLEAKEQHKRFILLEDSDGSHGTKTSTNIVAKY